jgi:ketosteroid isomerase-like protein
VLDNWHKAAGAAQFDAYFNLMTADAIFIGTDAENWNKMQFQAFAKPFDRGKAWSFKAMRASYLC